MNKCAILIQKNFKRYVVEKKFLVIRNVMRNFRDLISPYIKGNIHGMY